MVKVYVIEESGNGQYAGWLTRYHGNDFNTLIFGGCLR